ncbi:hypothetical protein SLS60_002468 [Paraconiothyrium brasiliense]|uniref:MYND-type domain-containing protein n=1 Tax=Paraconiothyrium brasiliense TaxID=300254 RepID=A0ABR3S3J0_9PLEO
MVQTIPEFSMDKDKTALLKCAKCARVPGARNRFDGLVLCKCKGRYYCNNTCREADADVHGPDCKTIEYLAQPEDMINAPDMIKRRDKASAEMAKQDDVIYHLVLEIHMSGKPKRARYIAPFVELAGLEEKIQETIQDGFKTVVPSGAFLSELLHAPVSGLAGIEEIRIPFHGLEGSIAFHIHYEKANYIKYCYRSCFWSFDKLLYTVVIDTPKVSSRPHEIRSQFVTEVEVEATFGSMVSAVACVKAIVNRWNNETSNYESKTIPVDQDSVRGVMTSSRMKTIELKHVRIITRCLLQAGGLKGSNGKAIMMGCQDRDGFAKRKWVAKSEVPKKAATGAQSVPDKRIRPDEDVDQDRSEVKRIRVVEYVDLIEEDEDGEAT